MLQVKLGLYFNALREAESIKAAGYQLFKQYHAFLYNQEVYYRVHSPPLDVALNYCCIRSISRTIFQNSVQNIVPSTTPFPFRFSN
jgi:hypothetical protein